MLGRTEGLVTIVVVKCISAINCQLLQSYCSLVFDMVLGANEE